MGYGYDESDSFIDNSEAVSPYWKCPWNHDTLVSTDDGLEVEVELVWACPQCEEKTALVCGAGVGKKRQVWSGLVSLTENVDQICPNAFELGHPWLTRSRSCLKSHRRTQSYLLYQDPLCTFGLEYQNLELTVCFPPFSMMSLFQLLWLQSMEDFTLTREPCSLDKHPNLRMTSLKKRRRNLQRLEWYLLLDFRSAFLVWLYKISSWLAKMLV